MYVMILPKFTIQYKGWFLIQEEFPYMQQTSKLCWLFPAVQSPDKVLTA